MPAGSFALHTVVQPDCIADVAVQMPKACFDEKDQLNHRYHAKRALYLLQIALALEMNAQDLGIESLQWTALRGDPRRPALLLRLRDSKAAIRLLPALPPSTFPLQRLAPGRNNLRSACAPRAAGASAEEHPLLPTPYYNAGIVEDLLLMQHAQTMQAAASNARSMRDAAVLLHIWAAHQRLADGTDGVDGTLLTMLLTHLLESGRAVSYTLAYRELYYRVALMNSKFCHREGSPQQELPLHL